MTAVEATPAATRKEIQPLLVRVGAELIGSFLVCFAIYITSALGLGIFGVYMSFVTVAIGCIYALATYIFGRISGAHFNPAITIAAMLVGKTRILDGVLYIIVQVLGAIAAGFAVKFMLPVSEQVTASVWYTPAVNGFENGSISYATLGNYGITFGITMAIVVEVVAGLLIVSTAMRTMNESDEANGRQSVMMGVAYGVGAAITYPVTGAALNPARSTGIAIVAQGQGLTQEPLPQLWVFWICPVLAAAIVALTIIVVQMAKDNAAKKQAAQPAAAEVEAVQELEREVVEESTNEDAQTEAAPAEETSHTVGKTEVQSQQSDTQQDADKGIERD